jgi:formate hydrogenlyase subunit 6/NADH:ubiquinone oxidoreductase subunit I
MAGLVGWMLGWRLLALWRRSPRRDFTIDVARCVNCGRCFEACPQGRRRKAETGANRQDKRETPK